MSAAGISNAAELARRTGVNESQISRWLRGIGQPDLSNLRKIAPTLRRPMLQLLVAAGHLTAAEARMQELPVPTREDVDVVEAIERDTLLLPEAKAHFLNQYELLRRLGEPAQPVSAEEQQSAVRALKSVARGRRGGPSDLDQDVESRITEEVTTAVSKNPHARKRRDEH
jgi:transcriptional regulator with XRE-family HTH domain